MPQMQEEVDERELLGQHGARMYQVPHQRLPSQAGNTTFMIETEVPDW